MRLPPLLLWPTICLLLLSGSWALGEESPIVFQKLQADRAEVTLSGAEATWQLLVAGTTSDKSTRDATHAVEYRSRDSKIAVVSDTGVITAKANGQTVIDIAAGETKTSIAVTVNGTLLPRHLNF